MDNKEVAALREVMSQERLAPYETACAGDLAATLRLYAWNVGVSAAFHGPLGSLEVALRNAMHLRLAALYGREDWWGAPEAKLHWVSAKKVGEAGQELMRRRKPPTPCRVVAELSLGFWVSLLGTGNDYETRLWRPALRLAFPGYGGARKHLHWEFDHVRSFRNRIAHHEPIYRRHLAADHETVLRLIGYISPKYANWVSRHDRVPELLSSRGEVCRGALPARF